MSRPPQTISAFQERVRAALATHRATDVAIRSLAERTATAAGTPTT